MRKLDNYRSNLGVLAKASEQDLSNEFVQGGVINKFFVQFELGWKLLKELLAYEGISAAATGSPREVIKAAWRYYDFLDEELWLRMLRDRNDTAHIYDASSARALVDAVISSYVPEFQRVESEVVARYGEDPDLS